MKSSLFVIFLLMGALSGVFQSDDSCTWVHVDKVVDGDTLRLKDGRWVRCASIDTPEIDHRNRKADPMGYEARNFLRRQVVGKRICMRTGPKSTDGYGRIIGYLFDAKGVMINEAIVSRGLGHVYPHADQDKRYSKTLLEAQRQAMRQRLGIWKHRLSKKGALVGNRRSKRFHLQSCLSAKQIKRANRRGFDTIWDAYWAGYAPAAGCLGSPIKKELNHQRKQPSP